MDRISQREIDFDNTMKEDICTMPMGARLNKLSCHLKESGLNDWMVCKDTIGRVTITQHKAGICPKYWSNIPDFAPKMNSIATRIAGEPIQM